MKGIWSRSSVALLIILVVMVLVCEVPHLVHHGKPSEVLRIFGGGLAFIGVVSLLGGIYSAGRMGRGLLFLDLLCGILIYASAVMAAIHAISENLYGLIALLCAAILWASFILRFSIGVVVVRSWWKGEAGQIVHGLRLIGAGLVLFAVPAVLIGSRIYERIQLSYMSRAAGEIRNVDLACTKLLSDADAKYLRGLFQDPALIECSTVEETIVRQTRLMYELLRTGRDADIGLTESVKRKLAPSYMNLGDDPWGHRYRFYFGPLNKNDVNRSPLFRCYRRPWKDKAAKVHAPYVYDPAAYEFENELTKGNPVPEPDVPAVPGYPCPRDLPIYVFSCGANGKPDQPPWGGDGGDDINNWDSRWGWEEFYDGSSDD